ncbi:MAG TPA: hypothetical protein VEH50_14040 [Methylomirabilota bacterium]|nr:hypothetical protein [Methylomirabilota bacterium]
MPVEDALHNLGDPGNQQIEWAIGDLLRLRAKRANWRECSILQQLETGRNINAWNDLFRQTRQALARENDLVRKARTILRPDKESFDQSLEDFIAEMMASIYLAHSGHTDITLPKDDDPITTDLISAQNGTNYVTEAKNLREPNNLAYVAFARWHYNRAAHPDIFNFTVELLNIERPFEDLTSEQTLAVEKIIDSLPARARPSKFTVTLPESRTLSIGLRDGNCGMLQYGPGPFLVNERVEECQRAVIMKLLEPTRKALMQLYSLAVPPNYRKLLFVRWKPPDSIVAIGEAGSVREAVRDRCQEFIRSFFPNFAVVIAHTNEQLESVPPPSW